MLYSKVGWPCSSAQSYFLTFSGLSLSRSKDEQQPCVAPGTELELLSVVRTLQVPLYMSLGKPFVVTSSHAETEQWFSAILLGQHHDDTTAWWRSAATDSSLGILVAVKSAIAELPGPKITELLFYAAKETFNEAGLPSPPKSSTGNQDMAKDTIRLYALPLSSDLHHRAARDEPTPPPTPQHSSDEVDAVFLPLAEKQDLATAETINRPPVRKRKSVNETFDKAAERRHKARRKGGEGVAAAAATKTETTLQDLKHRPSISNNQVPVQNRPLSRSSSVASAKPHLGREPSVSAATKASALSQVQTASAAGSPEKATTESKNKDLVSKVVMAGMRLHGLHQSKRRRSRANSTVASPTAEASFEEIDAERQNDEDFKLIYHQVYKGTCFAFRSHIAAVPLHSRTDAVRDTVDRLLAIFCSDPLTVAVTESADDYTPGGRKVFGSSALPESKYDNPFVQAAAAETTSKTNTPCSRKPKDDLRGLG